MLSYDYILIIYYSTAMRLIKSVHVFSITAALTVVLAVIHITGLNECT